MNDSLAEMITVAKDIFAKRVRVKKLACKDILKLFMSFKGL